MFVNGLHSPPNSCTRHQEAYSLWHMSQQDPSATPEVRTARGYAVPAGDRKGAQILSRRSLAIESVTAEYDKQLAEVSYKFVSSRQDLLSELDVCGINQWHDDETDTDYELILDRSSGLTEFLSGNFVAYNAQGAMVEQLNIDDEHTRGLRATVQATNAPLVIEQLDYQDTYELCQRIRTTIHEHSLVTRLEAMLYRHRELAWAIKKPMMMTDTEEAFDAYKQALRAEKDSIKLPESKLWQLDNY